jgi:KR domain/Phosphopantetheine attachment site
MAAKVEGAAHLDEVLRGRDLDAFVLISSAAAIWGAARQGAYAAANSYLDALAERRRARGEAAVPIAWGAWAGEGMVAEDGARQQLERRAVLTMRPGQALKALGTAAAGDRAATVVAADQLFHELGFDSLTAVGLRNRLAGATGQRLPATLVYDHESSAAVARHLLALLAAGAAAPAGGEQPGQTLGETYRRMVQRGMSEEMHRFGLSAAGLRETACP